MKIIIILCVYYKASKNFIGVANVDFHLRCPDGRIVTTFTMILTYSNLKKIEKYNHLMLLQIHHN